MERKISFEPAYDKRSSDPAKDYGIGSVGMRFILRGEFGAVVFYVGTGWFLKDTEDRLLNNMVGKTIRNKYEANTIMAMAYDLGWHSKNPMYEDQNVSQEKCCFLDDTPCYYYGTSLGADRVFDILKSKGDEAVWEELESCYKERFGELK